MKQHINWKIKYQYVKRYILKEKITFLQKELSLKKLISKNHNNAIFVWYKKYLQFGKNGLKSKSGYYCKRLKKIKYQRNTELNLISKNFKSLNLFKNREIVNIIEKYRYIKATTSDGQSIDTNQQSVITSNVPKGNVDIKF